MGFEDVQSGENVSAAVLRNADFVACVYRGLVDDYARMTVKTLALKVFKGARKKFSKLIIKLKEREVSAWDYYCYGLYRGNTALRDKFISDFIRLSLMRRVDALPEENRRLIEISACRLDAIDERTVLDREAVLTLVHAEIKLLALEHGRMLHQSATGELQAAIAVKSSLMPF